MYRKKERRQCPCHFECPAPPGGHEDQDWQCHLPKQMKKQIKSTSFPCVSWTLLGWRECELHGHSSSLQRGFALHFADCGGAFACKLEDSGLLCAGVILSVVGISESFVLLTLLPITISWIDDQEASGQETQEGATGCHHGDDTHAAHCVHHCTQCWRHDDLRDVHLAGQYCAVDAEASLWVARAVMDILWNSWKES